MSQPRIHDTSDVWARHGYRLERIPKPMGAPERNVYGPDGALLLPDTDLQEEIEYLQANAMLPALTNGDMEM